MSVQGKKRYTIVYLGMFAISLVLLGLVTVQNQNLKQNFLDAEIVHRKELTKNASLNSLTLRLINKKLPVEISRGLHFFQKSEGLERNHRHLLMMFNSSVCGSCLSAHARYIQQIEDRMLRMGVKPLAVAGTETEREKAEITIFHRENKFSFPLDFVEASKVDEMIGVPQAPDYSNTPVFFLLERDLTIRGVFKPDGSDTTGLSTWIQSFM
jgi:hypothetical protein